MARECPRPEYVFMYIFPNLFMLGLNLRAASIRLTKVSNTFNRIRPESDGGQQEKKISLSSKFSKHEAQVNL